MKDYEINLEKMGLNENQIKVISDILQEKAVGEYFSPDEHYPANPVAFLAEWAKEKKTGSFGELRIDGLDNYLVVADENPDMPEAIIPSINSRVESAGEMLCSVLVTLEELRKEDIDLKDFQEADDRTIDKALDMLEGGYYAADIFTYIHEASRKANPGISLDESVRKSVSLLRCAEELFYDEPIQEYSVAEEFYAMMKQTIADFKEMVHSFDNVKAKGRELLKVFGNGRSEEKGRSNSR